jgi:hypothetical protein
MPPGRSAAEGRRRPANLPREEWRARRAGQGKFVVSEVEGRRAAAIGPDRRAGAVGLPCCRGWLGGRRHACARARDAGLDGAVAGSLGVRRLRAALAPGSPAPLRQGPDACRRRRAPDGAVVDGRVVWSTPRRLRRWRLARGRCPRRAPACGGARAWGRDQDGAARGSAAADPSRPAARRLAPITAGAIAVSADRRCAACGRAGRLRPLSR